MRKRVVLLQTGGTLAMRAGPKGSLTPGGLASGLLAEMPVLDRIADIDARVIADKDSSDMQPSDWQRMAAEAHSALADPRVDGVVVTHGTDTMAYSASAVALMLGPLPKPLVFTGAQRPLIEPRTDARTNLIDACLLATMGVPEVGVAFASRLWRAVRTIKHDACSLDAFASPTCSPLVDLGLREVVGAHVRTASPLAALDDRLETNVVAMRVFPGLDAAPLRRALVAGVRGILLEGYGTGNLPTGPGSLITVLEEAASREVPVMVVSQCPRGAVELGRYAGGAAAEAAGAISGGQMTIESALAKMMIGLGRYNTLADVRAFLEGDLVGERL